MKSDLTQGDITKHIRMIALPASVGYFFNTMFNVVDTYFGGKLGDDALAGLSASFPAFFIILAASFGIATATTALIANYHGKKDEETAKAYYTQGIFLGVVCGIVLSIIGLLLSRPLLELMNLPEGVIGFALDYLNTTFLGTTFFILVGILNSYLNAIGNTKLYRNLLISSFFLNIFFNPLFMYGWFGLPAMGISGVAFATVLVQIIESSFLIYYLRRKKVLVGSIFNFKANWGICKKIFIQAIPSSFNMMSVAVGAFIISFFIAKFGADAIAAYGVAIRIEQIALIPTIGLNIAALSIIGQNNGAKKFGRIQETIRKSIGLGFYALLLSAFVIVVLGKYIIAFFTPNGNISSIAMTYLYVSLFIFVAYVISFISGGALQGIKYPNRALWVGILRQIVLPLIIFSLVAYHTNFGLMGIWISILVINWIGAIISIIVAERSIAEKEEEFHLEHSRLV
ncbi:MAG: MatE-like protein domain efflux pump [Candidatus Taylorbacteria bacterium]|nr:MatE-like protein domain efflux pump [Candidatus Taylorbacteria bacterium]